MPDLFSQLTADGVASEPLPSYPELLKEAERLYHRAGRLVVERHAGLVASPSRFTSLMDDLHRGLLLKVYLATCEADRRWSSEERKLAEELAEHLWRRRLRGKELAEAMREGSARSQQLSWDSLVGPFRRLEPLADFAPMLETLVIRQANLIARCDGPPVDAELATLRDITHQLKVALDPTADHISLEEEKAETGPASTPSGPSEPAEATRSLEEVLGELDSLVGLAGVKKELRSLANFLSLQTKRSDAGLPATTITLHMVFVGNPGTGKTTVARLVGEALAALGVLPNGRLVETDRSGLVAEYAGQTAGKVNQRVDEAMGGVLFIDEAYSIINNQGEDAFGAEAIQTLLKRAEDDRDQLSIVLAGYPTPMDELLRSNPGLESRFSRKFAFDDYSPIELCAIFGRLLQVHHYQISPEARLRVIETLTRLHAQRDANFGNGRTVRNLFEQSIMRLADRIASMPQVSKEQLITFEADDIGPAEAESADRVRITCPGCHHHSAAPPRVLGARLGCPKCEERFVAEWGELIEPDAAEPNA